MKNKLELEVVKNLVHWVYSEGIRHGKEGVSDTEISENLNYICETLEELSKSPRRPLTYDEWMQKTGEIIKGFHANLYK
jgi:hypothetical protein